MSDLPVFGRTEQQKFVQARLRKALDDTTQANERLDKRALLISGTSTGLMGLIVGAEALSGSASSWIQAALIAGLVVLAIAIKIALTRVWLESWIVSDGSENVDKLYDEIVAVQLDVAWNQVMLDLEKAVARATAINQLKWKHVHRMIVLLEVQLGVLVAVPISRLLS